MPCNEETNYRADEVDGPQEMKEIKQQPSMLPGPAVPGICLVSFYFLCAILSTSTVFVEWKCESESIVSVFKSSTIR